MGRTRLANTPTPLLPAPALSGRLGRGVDVSVKADAWTGLGLGGNKVRKIEYELDPARLAGVTHLVTAGGPHSNHCRVTAAAAAHLGLGCALVIDGEPEDPARGNPPSAPAARGPHRDRRRRRRANPRHGKRSPPNRRGRRKRARHPGRCIDRPGSTGVRAFPGRNPRPVPRVATRRRPTLDLRVILLGRHAGRPHRRLCDPGVARPAGRSQPGRARTDDPPQGDRTRDSRRRPARQHGRRRSARQPPPGGAGRGGGALGQGHRRLRGSPATATTPRQAKRPSPCSALSPV